MASRTIKASCGALVISAGALLTATSAHAIAVVADANATSLANAIAGSGITISNAVLTVNGTGPMTGKFSGGAASVGFDSGIVLTTGTIDCVPGPNDDASCDNGSNGTTSELKFDFESETGNVFFQYVFGSEEYNEFTGSQFNDQFELLLNGVNIALVPGGGGIVSINNVNCSSNAAYYRNNNNAGGGTAPCTGVPSLGLDIQYDGLTTVLTASGSVGAGVNQFIFRIRDLGDAILDSGVFIRAGSFSGTNPNVPEPGTLALLGLGLAGLGLSRRRKGI